MKNSQNKNFIWNTIGLTLYCFVSFLLLIVVNNINGANEAGIFSYSFAICTLFFYISLYFNRTYQITDKSIDFNQYLTTRILTCFISFFSIIVFSIISSFSYYKILVIAIIMLFRIVDAISDTFYGFFQNKDKLYIVGISYSIKSIISILFFVVIDFITNQLIFSLLSFLISYTIISILYDYRLFKNEYRKKIIFDFSNTKIIILRAFPIFLFQSISIYLSNCSKYILTYFTTNEVQAIFGILIMPATILSLVGNYLIQPFVKILNDYKVSNKIFEFKKIVQKILVVLFMFGVFPCFVSNFLGIPLLEFIYKTDLKGYKIELLVILVAATFNAGSMIISGILTILNKNKIQVYFYLICSILTTIICYLLIKNGTNPIYEVTISYFMSSIALFIMFLFYYLISITKIQKGSEKNG